MFSIIADKRKTIPFTPAIRKLLCLSSLGGVLEYYDFIIYIFLAPFIEQVFFANSSAYVATLKTLAIFSIGYLFRPLGGIVFSHFGDRYGRKVVFLLTVVFMALPSFAIGLLPTTGALAPLLLLIFRMMQGFALGGEIPAAITFVAEHVQDQRRAFALSTLFFGINIGLLLGSLVTTLLTAILSNELILDYGWRIPFLIGGVFGIIAIFLRRYLHETVAFAALKQQEVQRVPFMTLMRQAPREVLVGMLLVMIGSVSVFFYLYWPQYLHQYMHYDFASMMHLNTISTLILCFTILFGGWLADRFGSRTVYLGVTALLVILTYPLFMLFNLHGLVWVIISYSIFSILFGFIPGTYSSMLTSLFPTPIRYSGVAASYNLAYAFFGGLSPLICTYAIHAFNDILAPAIYISLIASISWISCYIFFHRKSTYLHATPLVATNS